MPVNEFTTKPSSLSRKTTFNDNMKESFMKTQVPQEEFEWEERLVASSIQQSKELCGQNEQLQTLIDEHVSVVRMRHQA